MPQLSFLDSCLSVCILSASRDRTNQCSVAGFIVVDWVLEDQGRAKKPGSWPGCSGPHLGGSARPQSRKDTISIRSSVHFSLRLQVFQVQGKLGSGAKVGHGGTLDPFATGVHASNMNNVLFFAGHVWTCLRSVTLDFVT